MIIQMPPMTERKKEPSTTNIVIVRNGDGVTIELHGISIMDALGVLEVTKYMFIRNGGQSIRL